MASLDDLAASLLLGSQDKPDFAEQDPYIGFANIGNTLTNTIAKNAGNYSTKDDILASLVSGLITGGASSLSDSFQSREKDAYLKAANDSIAGHIGERPDILSNKLFDTANSTGKLFQTIKGMDAQKLKDANDLEINKSLLTQYGIAYDPKDPDMASKIQDAIKGKKAASEKPITPNAIQKISTGSSLLGQIEKAKGLVDKMADNPSLGGLSEMFPLLGKAGGAVARTYEGGFNDTAEGIYAGLMQQVQEGTGKFISNSARQKIIDENLELTKAGALGSKGGIKTALQNIQDIISQDLIDQGSGFGEQGYAKIQDAIEKAKTYQSDNPTAAVVPGEGSFVTVTNPKTGTQLKVPANDPRLKLILGAPVG